MTIRMHRETIIKRLRFVAVLIALCVSLTPVRSQQSGQDPKPVLYVVGTSHLDSQWNWTVQDSIRQFVPQGISPGSLAHLAEVCGRGTLATDRLVDQRRRRERAIA